jgi:phosphoribosyl 1,2-cyclic phosphodiesterase
MSLFVCSLNSGSNGNSYYVGSRSDAVLIDAGINCREVERRMKKAGLSPDKVRAIFISHEHTDHTRGVEVLSRKHRIPVYISSPTMLKSMLWFEPDLLRIFSAHDVIRVGDLEVKTFPKLHDGIDPHSFTVSSEGVTAGVFTDIGGACENLTSHFSACHAAFLESNYDDDMLRNGRYPVYLKRRISGGNGHLSNTQALEIFMKYRAPHLHLLVLSHLSEQNNHPGIVSRLFAPHANGTHIAIASRYSESRVFTVDRDSMDILSDCPRDGEFSGRE